MLAKLKHITQAAKRLIQPTSGSAERSSKRRLAMRLLGALVLLSAAQFAHAGTDFCSQYPLVGQFHVIDGNTPSLNVNTLPSSIGIDANCRFENFQISSKWPDGLTSTLNFKFDGYLAIFENVYYSGNMACANTTTKIWFVNNAVYDPNNSCQDLFIPVETIGKHAPGPTATVGVPFTYTMTIPVMYDPSTNTYYNNPSQNNLIDATIYDDLTATGADLTYVSNTAYAIDTFGTKTSIGSLNLFIGYNATAGVTGDNTKHLIFDYSNNPNLTSILAGTQIEIQLTLVLDSTGSNTPGTQFINTAKWWFGRRINTGTDTNPVYTDYAPLPGQAGVSEPMTIADPQLVMTKTASVTNLNVGSTATYTLDAQNTGGGDAWNTTITDNIPTGMCNYDPTSSTITVGVFAADGTTPVSGLLLVPGTDYTVSWAPYTNASYPDIGCRLIFNMLTSKTKIGPSQRLIITYQDQLDASISSGSYTNVAGATQWYNDDATNTARQSYSHTLSTDGTPSTVDYQDAFTITAATAGYYFLKTAQNLTTGAVEDATTGLSAFPGDTIRYTLQIQNFNIPTLYNISASDDLSGADFAPGTLRVVSTNLPAGTYAPAVGGTSATNQLSVNNLDLPESQQYYITFDVTLSSSLTNGSIVINQASMTGQDDPTTPTKFYSGKSDDPYVNGTVQYGDATKTPDPTPVTIQTPNALSKTNPAKITATIGETFVYQIKVPATPVNVPLYDVKIVDPLAGSAANMSFVSASVVSGGSWSLVNTGTATSPVIEDQSTGIDIPAGGQAVINVTVKLDNTTTNVSGLNFTNSAYYTYNKVNGDNTSQGTTNSVSTTNMTVVEPSLTASKTVSYSSPAGKAITSAANVGDVLLYTVTIPNNGTSEAYDTDVLDYLPANLTLVANSATAKIGGVPVNGFESTPTTLTSGALVWGFQNGDSTLDIPVGQSLVLTYKATVVAVNGAPISNSVYVDWSSLDNSINGERTGDGCGTSTGVTAPNTYCSGPVSTSLNATDPTALTKSVVSDSWITSPSTANDRTVRIGDTVIFNLALTLPEGTTDNVVVSDSLPSGLAFDGTISISPSSANPGTSSNPFTYSVVAQPSAGATGTISWNLGSVDNAIDNDLTNNTLTIQFRAKVLNNNLAQTPVAQLLTNNASLNYSIGGLTATPKTASVGVNVWQPLLTISKSAAPAGGDSVIGAGEDVTYTVSIQNTGNAPAYDTLLQDKLPVGLRTSGITMVSITITNGTNTTTPANLAPTYSSGVATWDFSGAGNAYAIPPGYTMNVVYKVTSDATLGAGATLTNMAQVLHYYSFGTADVPSGSVLSDRQDYGATGIASTTLTTASPLSLSKQALVSSAAVGQPFTYRITVPATPQSTALNDVQVLDDIGLTATGVSLNYIGASAHLVSNAKTWSSLTNTGSPTNLVLVDNASGGLDIPAGDQLVVDVTVVLTDDTTNNTTGKSFTNTANYKYNTVNDDITTVTNGAPGASGAVTIAAPNLIMDKTGPATMYLGAAGSFSLSVLNNGTAAAWNTVITDKLPYVTSSPSGGMCTSAPTITSAGIYNSSNTLVTVLSAGTDYSVSYVAAPTCEYTITLLSAAAAIPAGDHLLINYNASLDPGTASNLPLTNIAGATQYLSSDPNVTGATGNVHTYNNTLTDGTPTVTDFQDAFTVTTASPTLIFTKDVYDVTTSSSGTTAHPGDVLRYTITINNTGTVDANNFSLTDDLDNLNSTAMFVANTLNVASIPSGAVNSSVLDGGSKNTGYVSISNLSVAAGNSISIVYTVQLVPVINSGTVVLNQGQIVATTITTQLSDDPNTATASDPTHTRISSAPVFKVEKTSADLTGSSTILLAGDTLRYTITVNNIGNENAVNAVLKDQIPANTTYVAGSTTLNGNPVADPATGVSALQNGLLIYSPSDTTPGHLPADSSSGTANTATITFDVTINTGVLSGTVISNQAYLTASGAGSGSTNEQPSDDPNTTVLNDPTLNVIGNVPLIDAVKTVSLDKDINGNGYVDANDTLLYTITVTNYGKVQATGVTLTDAIPANTTYVPGSTTLNTLAVSDPSATTSALEGGMPISSSDLTPPVPAVGYLSPGGTATITFKVTVNNGVGTGVVISNQGYVTSNEQAVEPTDADGNDSNGDQPTLIVTGNAQQLSITKQVSVVGGGAATAGGQVEYMVTVTNVGMVPATNVLITDNLDEVTPGYMTYVNGTAMLNGSTLGISYTSPALNADYSTAYGPLQPGQSAVLRFRADLNANLPIGTRVTNLARTYWNLMSQTDSAQVSIDIGGTPGSGTLSGQVWHDDNYNNTYDSGEQSLANWDIQVWFKGKLLGTVQSDSSGNYSIAGLAANYSSATTVDPYELRFYAPGAGPNTAKLGKADSSNSNGMYAPSFADDLQRISNIVFKSGENVSNLNLPIDPNGVVYDSIVRVPVAGATLTLVSASTNAAVSSACFDDPVQQNQVTTANGYYKFDLNFSQADCPAGGDYLIRVTAPTTGYVNGESAAIPAQTNASTTAFSVPGCIGTSNDAVPATSSTCEVQTFTTVPPLTYSPGTAQTKYYLKLTLNNPTPGNSQIFNNPIPIDPDLSSAMSISKVSPKVNVTRGELVPYTITIHNTLIVALTNVTIHDDFPAGFKYVKGSARVNGVATEPTINGLHLSWNTTIPAQTTYTIKLLLIVGSGVQDNDYVNRAYIYSNVTNSNASGVATATVHVVPDPTFDCSDIVGKVFDDKNFNGRQDKNERGIGGVRLATVRGLLVTTDQYGRFHLTCAAVPNEQRGSNFILKLDEHSLPTGFRMTTENPRVQRLTRGKAINFNFGATLHHVVTLDLADGVFEHDSDKMRSQWVPRLGLLIDQLRKSPSVLRLTYLADVEAKSVVDDRIDAIKQRIMKQWDQTGSYPLTIETEIFWRHGGPVDKGRLSQ